MTKSDGSIVEDLFTAVIFGDVELDKKTSKPSKDLIFRVDVEKCADVIAKEGIESFRKLLIENFEAHTDSIINGKLLP
jgi:hypothetical protein